VPADKVHREFFYVDDVSLEPVRGDKETVTGPSSRVTVVLDSRETTLALPRDVPVLDSAQKVPSDLPFACKAASAGRAAPGSPTARHTMRRNYALEPREVEAGYVLTCQSLPLSDTVIVDFDA
jgi:ring-1,2-phenylacetyl-CoA epoxidase subunit PaaE